MEKRKKELLKISPSGRLHIIPIIEKILEQEFSDLDIKKLKNKNYYRCRYWSYRIVFSIEWDIVSIIKIWTRWDVYNNL